LRDEYLPLVLIAETAGVIESQGEPARSAASGSSDDRAARTPKNDTISRIKRWPDDADALLAFYDNAPADLGALQGRAF
jgi:hypothetical protein